MKSLSACFLTRNEESTIGRAVRSVKDVADEVIVVDTHSDDRTAEAAADAGAVVTQFTWGDDFAAGRDYTVRRAKGDWVLWMHGSEELVPEGHAALRECVAREGAFGYFVRIRNFTADAKPQADFGELSRAAETADLRLFRRRADLPRLFVGRLHPHFHPEVLDAVRNEGLEVRQSDVVLRHHAEPGPPSPGKLRFNLRLLEAELHDRPGQLHYLIEYGRTLLMLQDSRGHGVMAEAAAQVGALRDLPSPPTMKVQVLLNYVLGAPQARPAASLAYADARELAVRWFPNSPNVLWTLAEQSFRRKEYADAADHLHRLLQLGRSGAYDRSARFDPAILSFVQLTNDPRFGVQAGRMLALAQKWRTQAPAGG
jgi:hypothetical protein